MYRNDPIRVEKEYSCFNQHYTEYMKIYENLVNQEISRNDCPKTEQKLVKADEEEHTSNTQQETSQNVQCDQNLVTIEDQPLMKKSTRNFEMKTFGNEEYNKEMGTLSFHVSLEEEQNEKSCNWKYLLAFLILSVVIAGSLVGIFLSTACEPGYHGFLTCKGKI